MGNTILHTENLSIGYAHKSGQTVLASSMHLSLQMGQLYTLIGRNGIGKSTLLRTLTGIQSALSGNILLDGRPLDLHTPVQLAKKLALVLTEKLPASNLSVFELVALGRQPYTNWLGRLADEDRQQVQQALELTNTSAFAHKKYFEISDGQLQNVLIARALAQDTPLIVLDEPTTHLDLEHKAKLFGLLRKLAQNGKCILFSTHDIELALEISDGVIVMDSGYALQATAAEVVDGGYLDRLFPDSGIVFDAAKGRFVFRDI